MSGGLGGVIVAGGRARRLGQPKGGILVDGEPALVRLVAAYRVAHVEPIVVVVSPPTRALADAIDGVIVVDSVPEAEMIDSIARGLERLPPDVAGAIVQPVDAPFTTPEMIAALGVADWPRVLCHRGVPGHPVMLPARFFARVAARPDGGLRMLLAESEVELVEWDDRRVLADLDTAEDLEAWGLTRH